MRTAPGGPGGGPGGGELGGTIDGGVSAFVISFVVVGASIAIVTRIVTNELFQPATRRPDHGRGRHLRTEATPTPASVFGQASAVVVRREPTVSRRGWPRARSAVLLTLMIAILGLVAAAVIGLVTVALIAFLRDAVS